jgi:protein involved in polysaccharide export with SLBB domain
MNKIRLSLLCLLAAGSLAAQSVDLSKLSSSQKEAYMKYTQGGKTGTSTNKNDMVEEDENATNRTVDSVYQKRPPMQPKAKGPTIFGSQLFSHENLTFEPKLNIPTPPKYVLGSYDQLLIDISGLYEASYKLKITPDGTIRIPNVGPIKVSGMKIEDASRLIRNRVGSIYMGVNTGQTHVNVSLGNIRSIRVTMVGEVTRPGTYTLPSLATAFNALYACGGPDSLGTMRDIKVVRRGQVVAHIDVYQYLLDGVLSNNISLQDEDIIKIDSYKLRVSVKGAVKHNGLFEALSGETLKNLVRFAGGYTDNAYKGNITVLRLTDNERTVINVKENLIDGFTLKSGDSCFISTTDDKYDNRVDVNGYVNRPGIYAYETGMTVSQLIIKAGGLKENAYMSMAYITRKKDNQIPEVIGFNPGNVLNGTDKDILLQKNDSVKIGSLFDFREGQSVSIWGAVKSPGTFPLDENITLKGLLFKARGFSDNASTDSVELVRIIKDQHTLLTTDKRTTVRKFAIDKDLNFKPGEGDILLQNGDQVIVHFISGYETIRMVSVEGEVLKPGEYNINDKFERISDLVRRTGGFTRYAYLPGAYLIRTESSTGAEQKLKQIMADNTKKSMETQNGDVANASSSLLKTGVKSMEDYAAMDTLQEKISNKSSNIDEIYKSEGLVGIDLKEIMAHPGDKQDLYLEDGDMLYIPRELQTVRVLGEVLFPTYVRYDKRMSFNGYISNAGGFSNIANKKHAFVLYANGTAKSTSSFLGIKHYPKVKPGARIVIPQKPTEIKNKMSTAETISLMSSLATVAAVIVSLLK